MLPSDPPECTAGVLGAGRDICVPRMQTAEATCALIQEMKAGYDSGEVGAGMLEQMIPELLAKFTVEHDEETLFVAN
jgi:hypothetical protein